MIFAYFHFTVCHIQTDEVCRQKFALMSAWSRTSVLGYQGEVTMFCLPSATGFFPIECIKSTPIVSYSVQNKNWTRKSFPVTRKPKLAVANWCYFAASQESASALERCNGEFRIEESSSNEMKRKISLSRVHKKMCKIQHGLTNHIPEVLLASSLRQSRYIQRRLSNLDENCRNSVITYRKLGRSVWK